MQTISTEIKIQLLDFDELTAGEQMLISRACKVRLNAQAPYSNYWVGCSVMTLDGVFFDGCNVENVNWSETVHAEENAISYAVAIKGPFRISAMAVVGALANQEVVWPGSTRIKVSDSCSSGLEVKDFCPSCGHCLQIIAENCFDASGKFDPSVSLLGYSVRKNLIYRTAIGDAYPMPFLPQHLGVNYSKDSRFQKK